MSDKANGKSFFRRRVHFGAILPPLDHRVVRLRAQVRLGGLSRCQFEEQLLPLVPCQCSYRPAKISNAGNWWIARWHSLRPFKSRRSPTISFFSERVPNNHSAPHPRIKSSFQSGRFRAVSCIVKYR